MKRLIKLVARNCYLHLFLGAVVALSGLLEFGQTLVEDLSSGNIRSGHGVILLGLLHVARALAELVEASDYLNEGLK
jgi:hypothetical protein